MKAKHQKVINILVLNRIRFLFALCELYVELFIPACLSCVSYVYGNKIFAIENQRQSYLFCNWKPTPNACLLISR